MEKTKKKEDEKGRRCGFARRSFTYAHHIPERRINSDRRDTQECDLEPNDPPAVETETQREP